jgi:hypothetical protein
MLRRPNEAEADEEAERAAANNRLRACYIRENRRREG